MNTWATVALVVALLALAGSVFAYLNAVQIRRRLWRIAAARPSHTAEGELSSFPAQLRHLSGRVDELESVGNTWAQSLRHVAVVRYDAFGDVSGAQSWSLAILDDSGDGVVVTAINGREAARTYAKNVRAGESDAALSPEELEAISFARTDGLPDRTSVLPGQRRRCEMDKLTDAELSAALAGLGSWASDGDTIRREVEAPAFLTGIDYVREVAEVAEQADHHPDIDIRWRRLTFVLTTHDAGGLTQADVDLAHAIDAIVGQHGSAGD